MSNSRTYSFKSVGETLEEYGQTRRTDIKAKPPLGIKTPVQLDYDFGQLFEMHYSAADMIKDNFKNLILTNHGERVNMYDFGANLQELVMELGSDTADKEAMKRILKAVNKYMPFIILSDFEAFSNPREGGGPAVRGIRLTYSVPVAKMGTQAMDVILYMGG
jgi:phage baseplate assembly protein W